MKRICCVVLIALTVLLIGCSSRNDSSENPGSTAAASRISSSASVSISDIINSSAWKSCNNQQSKIVMKSGSPGILSSPNNKKAIYEQINSFLAKSVVYTKSVPKDNITHPFVEAAGYLGPPELTVSDQEHKIIINPAWYIDAPNADRLVVHQVPNILAVSIDGRVLYLQSTSFYNWMYNEDWKSSFHSGDRDGAIPSAAE